MTLADTLKKYIGTELRGVYTTIPAIVETVQHDQARCEVSLKDDDQIIIDQVPIASAYAGDGYGQIMPLKPRDEGFLICLKDPIDEPITQRGHLRYEKQRQHSYEDSVFFPRVWFDEDEIPEHEEGDYLLFHESESFIRITPEGEITIEHLNEHRLNITEDTVTLEQAEGQRVELTGDTATVEQADGQRVELSGDSATVEHSNGQRVELSGDSATVSAPSGGGNAEVSIDGSSIDITMPGGANRINISDAGPRIDGKLAAPLDAGMNELQNAVVHNRASDPSGNVPVGYLYFLPSTGELKIWGPGGPIPVAPPG